MVELMKVKILDIEGALFFSGDGSGENEVYLCKVTGDFFYKSDYVDIDNPLPDDLDDLEKYILIPTKHDLDLAHPRDFVEEKIPEQVDKLNEIFNQRGAYRRFKVWLHQINRIDDWYEYERQVNQTELRYWCENNDVELVD